ncbi:Oidioi.mRNA.OKI2018_I69.PAR.g11985.t1.cds [Oikopleura dioica]|uniref:Oidioi.mRNA.OKI2018_I69.PAR.g11985.t1.cds n=1 Tax=Oikopleura dioica TaxID=34765 RepID=A0ABN7S2L9_OIKDI|nr:Oidioi.mRNA.OKI2018_I69.PAR.g11985.t1.cds [Oikopleura dioica]
MKRGAFYPKDLGKLAENTAPRDNESTIAHSSDPGVDETEEKGMLTPRSRNHLRTERQKRQEEIGSRQQDSPENIIVNSGWQKSTNQPDDLKDTSLQYHLHEEWTKREQKSMQKLHEQHSLSNDITPAFIDDLQALSFTENNNNKLPCFQRDQENIPEGMSCKSSGRESFDPFELTENDQLNRPLGKWIQHLSEAELEAPDRFSISDNNNTVIIESLQNTSPDGEIVREQIGGWVQHLEEPKLGARERLQSSGNNNPALIEGLQDKKVSLIGFDNKIPSRSDRENDIISHWFFKLGMCRKRHLIEWTITNETRLFLYRYDLLTQEGKKKFLERETLDMGEFIEGTIPEEKQEALCRCCNKTRRKDRRWYTMDWDSANFWSKKDARISKMEKEEKE